MTYAFQTFFAYAQETFTILTLVEIAQVGRISILAIAGVLASFSFAIFGLSVRQAVYSVNQFFLMTDDDLLDYINYLGNVYFILDIVFSSLIIIISLYAVVMLVKNRLVSSCGASRLCANIS